MEMQIQDLVSAIKKEGIEVAQSEADKIIEEAKQNAAVILSKARDEAADIIKQAEERVEILTSSAKTTAEHAKRDAMIIFKKSVQDEFSKLLGADIKKAVNTEILAKLIIAAINEESPANYVAEVSEITESLKGELCAALNGGLEIKVNTTIRSGFKLTAKDGSGYFDCSDEELEKILVPFFPELAI